MKRRLRTASLILCCVILVGLCAAIPYWITQRQAALNTVYISQRSAICHKDPHCSGMKHYKVMTYEEAEGYFRFCSKCWDTDFGENAA